MIRSEARTEPLRYSYSRTTTYVDETGAPVGRAFISLDDPKKQRHEGFFSDDHGGWTYWTVLASAPLVVPARGQSRETAEVRWVRRDAVRTLPLHPGFAATWSRL